MLSLNNTPKKRWPSRLIQFVILIGLVSCGGLYYQRTPSAETNAASAAFTPAVVERRAIRQEITCSGPIVSNLDVEIKCKATGEVIELPFDISAPVKKGDLLLKIDPVDEERSVEQAQVKLAAAEAKYARAQQSLVISEQELKNGLINAEATLSAAQSSSKDLRAKAERQVALQEKKFASPEAVNSAQTAAIQADSALQKARAGLDGQKTNENRLELLRQDIKLAQTDVDYCKVDLKNAEQRLSETLVYAPIDGVVSDRLVEVGQIIASPKMNVGGGTALLTVSDTSRLFVLASVDESDIGHIQPGQSATISVDAYPDSKFTGRVVRVAAKGEKTSTIVTFEVKIEILDEGKSRLLPEMTADVEILAAANDDTLAVPSEAIQRRGAIKVVLVAGADSANPDAIEVQTGIDDGAYTEIVSGVQEKAAILIPQDTSKEKASESKGGFGGPPPGGPPPM